MDERKVVEAWRMFRIQAELVNGTEKLAKLGYAVSIYGSARLPESSPHYQAARKTGALFARRGMAVITGGGPGIMEAANRGAHEAGGISVGLNITLPEEQSGNPYQTLSLDFRYFFVRKYMFVKHAVGFVIFPGGFGSMDELFEVLTLIQTEKVKPFPIVLYGKKFWEGMLEWMRQSMVAEHCLRDEELHLMHLVDTPEEVVDIIGQHYDALIAAETSTPGI